METSQDAVRSSRATAGEAGVGKTAKQLVGLIPAAGRGTRLAPLPFSKELVPVGFQHAS